MSTGQRELGFIMIPVGIIPVNCAMTRFTLNRKIRRKMIRIGCVIVVIFMTGDTVG